MLLRHALTDAWQSMRRDLVSTAAAVLTIAVSLSLLGALLSTRRYVR